MEFVAALAAWAYGAIFTSPGLGPALNCQATIPELRPQLSPDAAILCPGSSEFANATNRWSAIEQPNITAVAKVITENDVSQVIQFANRQGIPYLEVSHKHGGMETLARMQNGIQIWTTSMDSVTIDAGAKTATIGAGVLTKKVTDVLWAAKKQTVTGVCECTGHLGPALGGGHGLLQGHYGLIADQIVEARVVLADGIQVIASDTSNPDLFYALKGAGHNFGVVTSLKFKIYDVPSGDMWIWESFIFTQDKLESVYRAINALTNNGTQSANLVNLSVFTRIPAIDPLNPVIVYFILYRNPPTEDSLAEEKKLAAPFHALNPVVTDGGQADYTQLPGITGNGLADPPCQHGASWQRYPVGLQEYNIETQRQLFAAYADITAQHPALNNSFYIFEGYSTQGVKAVPDESTAFPHRSDNLLLGAFMTHAPDPTLDPIAQKFGIATRKMLQAGSNIPTELHSYVNYARGDEGVKSWYGYDTERLQKLRDLKRKYDPAGKFNFFAPIV